MPFAIEALQSKSKLNNLRSRQFSQTLWPELRQKEDSTIVQAATHNIKSAVRELLARVKGAVDRAEGDSAAQAPEYGEEGAGAIVSDENDDGFLEINIVKRIRTGNKLLIATTVDHE